MKKFVWLIILLLIYKALTYIPIPGINYTLLSKVGSSSGLLNNLLRGDISKCSVFSMNISPYMTSTIIMQILSSNIGFSFFQNLKNDSKRSSMLLNDYTQYITIGVSFLQAIYLSYNLFHTKINGLALVSIKPTLFYSLSISSLIGGTMIMVWLSNQITQLGMGQGISMMICMNIISSLPKSLIGIFKLWKGEKISFVLIALLMMLVSIISLIIIFTERCKYHIAVRYPNIEYRNDKIALNRTIPLKINNTSIMPMIMTSAILEVPTVLLHILEKMGFFVNQVRVWLAWLKNPYSWTYYSVSALLTLFFIYQYSSISFDCDEIASNLYKGSVIIEGIRPLQKTSSFLHEKIQVLNFLTWIIFLIAVILPGYLSNYFNDYSGYFFVKLGSTSLIVLISVMENTIEALKTQSYNYHQFLYNRLLPIALTAKKIIPKAKIVEENTNE